MTQRLDKDHRNAQIMAQRLSELPLIDIDLSGVHSNIIVFWLRYTMLLVFSRCSIQKSWQSEFNSMTVYPFEKYLSRAQNDL